MKKFFKVLLVLLMIAGCSKEEQKAQVDVTSLGTSIQDKYYDTIMKVYNDAEVFSMFDLAAESVNQIYYAEAFLDVRSDLIGIFEVSSDDEAERLITLGQAVMQAENEEFIDYIKEEADKAIEGKVYRTGNYVVMICNANADEVAKEINEALN